MVRTMNYFVVTEPVVNLRREPSLHVGNYVKDALQESQLLFGEVLIGKEEKDGWISVEAIEQQCFKGEWKGYPGWVKASHLKPVREHSKKNLVVQEGRTTLYVDEQPFVNLSLGTKLSLIEELKEAWKVKLDDGRIGTVKKSCAVEISKVQLFEESIKRKRILELGKKMLGAPYLWGGRSTYDPDNLNTITSVDCSGLSSLLYRVAYGTDIPRDAHDQFLKCKPCNPVQLKIGDFIFLAPEAKPDRMSHVMLYVGYGEILEATEQTHSVQLISLKEKIGYSLQELSNEKKVKVKTTKGLEEYILFSAVLL